MVRDRLRRRNRSPRTSSPAGGITARQGLRDCTSLTVGQTAPDFDPSLVTLLICDLAGGQVDPDAAGDTVSGTTEWINDNPDPTEFSGKAFVRAQVLVNGSPIPITIDDSHDFRRQVDAMTYEVMVAGDGASHPVDFDVAVADLPTGTDMPVEVDPLVIENRRLDDF